MMSANPLMVNAPYGYAAGPTRSMGRQSCWRATVIVCSFLVFVASVALASLNSIPRDLIGDLGGLYRKRLVAEDDQWPHSLEPAAWVFYVIWPGNYAWCLLWMMYGLSTLCRRTATGCYLYVDPPYMPITLYIAFTLANLFGTGWVFLWDWDYTWIALIALAMMALFNIVALAATLYNLHKNKEELKSIGSGQEIGWVIGLVHNGLAMITAWTCFATLLNMIVVLIYDLSVDDETTCIIALSILSAEVLLWFVLDNFVFWRATKYTFTPYVVVCVTLVGILLEQWDIDSLLTIYTLVLLGFSGVFFLIKIILSFARSDRRKSREPLYATQPEKPPMMTTAVQPYMMKQAQPLPQPIVVNQVPAAQPMYVVQQAPAQRAPAVQYLQTTAARYNQRPAIVAPPPVEPVYMTRTTKPSYYY